MYHVPVLCCIYRYLHLVGSSSPTVGVRHICTTISTEILIIFTVSNFYQMIIVKESEELDIPNIYSSPHLVKPPYLLVKN